MVCLLCLFIISSLAFCWAVQLCLASKNQVCETMCHLQSQFTALEERLCQNAHINHLWQHLILVSSLNLMNRCRIEAFILHKIQVTAFWMVELFLHSQNFYWRMTCLHWLSLSAENLLFSPRSRQKTFLSFTISNQRDCLVFCIMTVK